MNKHKYLNNFIKRTLFALALFFSFTFAQAGTLTPPGGTPAAQFYTLSEIYEFITNNTTATAGGHAFTFADTLVGGGKTLTEIYNALATLIDPAKVLSGTTYLGVAGTIPTQTLSAANETVSAGYYDATTLSAVDADLTAANIVSGTTIFGVAGSATAGGGGYPTTGQTICYDTAGSVVDCAGTGQDGEYLKGTARSYTSSNVGSDYIVTDNATGLIWQKCSKGLSGDTCATGASESGTWATALTYCNDLDFAGQTDWRLPNIHELYSLLDFGDASAPYINATNFPATVSSNYWSSTSRPASFTSAAYVGFIFGSMSFSSKTTAIYIRCVRG